MTYQACNALIKQYQWDDGWDLPTQILQDSQCDMALALRIFYLADGYGYLINGCGNLSDWNEFIKNLYEKISSGEYEIRHTYEVPLTNVQKYKLKKMIVPSIFYEGCMKHEC